MCSLLHSPRAFDSPQLCQASRPLLRPTSLPRAAPLPGTLRKVTSPHAAWGRSLPFPPWSLSATWPRLWIRPRPARAPPHPAPLLPQGPLGAVPSAHAPRLLRLRLSRAELLLLVCALTFEHLSRGLVGPTGPAVSSGTCLSGKGRMGVEKPLAGCFR